MTDDDVLQVSSPAQLRALAHPFRQRLLFVLAHRSATISQLAQQLDAQKGNVAHHLKVLREAGMVAVVATRQVRGGTEQYYGRTTRRIALAGNVAAPTAAMMEALAAEIAAAEDEPLLVLRHVRLTAEQAGRLAAALQDLVAGAPDTAGQPRHGLLVGLYRAPADAGAARAARAPRPDEPDEPEQP